MGPTTRLSLAQHSYRAAIRAARAHSTPRTWARLVQAGRNLRDASAHTGRRTTGRFRPSV